MKKINHIVLIIFLLNTSLPIQGMFLRRAAAQYPRTATPAAGRRLLTTTPPTATPDTTVAELPKEPKIKQKKAPKPKVPPIPKASKIAQAQTTTIHKPSLGTKFWWIIFGKPIETSRSELSDLIEQPIFDKNRLEQAKKLIDEIQLKNLDYPNYINTTGLCDEILRVSFQGDFPQDQYTAFSLKQINLMKFYDYVKSEGGLIKEPIESYLDQYAEQVEKLYWPLLSTKANPKSLSAIPTHSTVTKELRSIEQWFDALDTFFEKIIPETDTVLLQKWHRIRNKRNLLKKAHIQPRKKKAKKQVIEQTIIE